MSFLPFLQKCHSPLGLKRKKSLFQFREMTPFLRNFLKSCFSKNVRENNSSLAKQQLFQAAV
jgi:hypothetical protein